MGRIEDLVNAHVARSVEVVCDGVVGDDLPDIKQLATRILQRGDRCLMILPGQDHLEKVLAVLRQAEASLFGDTSQGSLEEISLRDESKGVRCRA